MNRHDFELLGDKHKAFESRTTDTMLPGIPIVVRLDGKAFHTFTKGLERPFDRSFSTCMVETAKYLVEQTNADVAYTQSDEITIAFKNSNLMEPFMYNGRTQKIVSLFASMASVKFNQMVVKMLPSKTDLLPIFDARVFQYPTLELAAESFLWRETDATRNSLTMAAHHYYSTKELHGAGYTKKHEMLFQKGINWNDYPTHFKRGTYLGKRTVIKSLSDKELAKIPEKHRIPGKEYQRSVVVDLQLDPLESYENPVNVLF